jgi:hypothetical protein
VQARKKHQFELVAIGSVGYQRGRAGLEDVALANDDERLKSLKTPLRRVSATADGNCLFHALSAGLVGDAARSADVLRKDIVNEMERILDGSGVSFEDNLNDAFLWATDLPQGTVAYRIIGGMYSTAATAGGVQITVLQYLDRMRIDGEYGGAAEIVVASQLFGTIQVFRSGEPNELDRFVQAEGAPLVADIKLYYNGIDHHDALFAVVTAK